MAQLIQPIGWGLGLNGDGEKLADLIGQLGDSLEWCHNWQMTPPEAVNVTDKWLPTYFGYRWPPPETVWNSATGQPWGAWQKWSSLPAFDATERYDAQWDIPPDYWPFTYEQLKLIENRCLLVFNEPAYGWCPVVMDYERAAEYYHIILMSLLRYRWAERAKGRDVDVLLCAPSENIIGPWWDWLIQFHRILHRNSSDPHFYTLHLYSATDANARRFLEDRLKEFIDRWARGTKIVITESSPGPVDPYQDQSKAVYEHREAMTWLRKLLEWDEIIGVSYFAAFDQPSPGSGGTDPSRWNGPPYWGLYDHPELLKHWMELAK